jgi:hypothetical protein
MGTHTEKPAEQRDEINNFISGITTRSFDFPYLREYLKEMAFSHMFDLDDRSDRDQCYCAYSDINFILKNIEKAVVPDTEV